ncbi:MAG: ABC transporter ATP-binding protein [Candidatus Pacebacteria bacterium]|nr:ABC transporter ATP-binding protein [Candidatus Paceibacterota bacterium]
MNQEILLQLKNISVQYGGVKALDGVDVALDEGEIVALMGPNGAGKSTILKTIFGLAPIRTGQLLWREQAILPVPHQMVRRGAAFVPQGRRVFRNLTVKENLEIGAFAVKDKKIIKQRIERILELFPDLKKKLELKSRALSGGQQQMLAFARGLMTDPKVLLLDEPSLGLSPKIVKEVFVKIKEINTQRRTAILVVEHNIKSLLEVADRTYVLDKGKIVTEGDSRQLLKNDIIKKVFLGKLK